jgi:hypothetical protein
VRFFVRRFTRLICRYSKACWRNSARTTDESQDICNAGRWPLGPQGKPAHHALESLDFSGLNDVRAGKLIRQTSASTRTKSIECATAAHGIP